MRSYEPRVEVRLIKAIRRKIVVNSIPVVEDRYGNLAGINLTDYLGEHGGVKLSKSVRDPAGAFSITISDKPHTTLLESIYALVEPMDMIEVRLAHDPSEYRYKKGSLSNPLPVVMRGLVSSIVRNETMSGGKPTRTVTIAGQDFGKILSIIQIFYLNGAAVGENILSLLAYFHKYSEESAAKLLSASEYVLQVLEKVVNPYMAGIAKLADGDAMDADVMNRLLPDITVQGSVSPYTLASFNNTTLHAMLATVLDVGPFNEMFVEDRPAGACLVVRPTPFIPAGGGDRDFVQEGAWAHYVDVPAEDIVAANVNRGDHGVANFYWVGNSRWALMSNQTAKELAQQGRPETFALFEYYNSAAALYGVRKMEVESTLGHPEYSNSDSAKAERVQKDANLLGAWLDKRRADLAAMNKDNVLFESGSLRLRGNETIRAGCYLRVKKGSLVSRYYVTRVDHDFIPYQGYFTTVAVERGTGFIERSQVEGAPFYAEMNPRGLS